MSPLEETLAFQMRALKLPTPEREVTLIPGRKFRFDFVWPALKLALEVDGGEFVRGRHQRPAGFRRDAEKYSLAVAEGYRVLRVTGSMVNDGSAVELVRRALGVAA